MANEETDVLRIVPQFRVAEQTSRIQNVYYARCEALVDPADATILTDWQTIIQELYATIEDFVTETFTGEDIRITNVSKRERVGVTPFTFAGTDITTEPLPPQTAAEVLIPLKEVGRTGRKYVGPLAENAQDAGVITAAALSALGDFATFLVTQYTVVASANVYDFGIARFAGKVFQDFASYEGLTPRVVDTLRTQRRRTAGFGLS